MKQLIALGLVAVAAQTFAQQAHFETDMDHKVQFKLSQSDSKSYQLEVARLGNVSFERMNLFATRKARQLCEGEGYSITYESGVEEFDERKQKPNFIFPSLKVSINCP